MDSEVMRYRLDSLSVAILDDHEVVLEGLNSYMVKAGVRLMATFKVARELLDSVAANRRFDVYIIDVELPDMSASDLIDELRSLHPQARIIVNTMHEELWVVRKMAEKQVDGVVYKSGRLEHLLQAVVTVAAGGQYFCSKFKRKNQHLVVDSNLLSRRELDVLQSIAQGHSTKEIAHRLFISENTVETHRQNLFSKLKAHNMADLIVKAISYGYINPKQIDT